MPGSGTASSGGFAIDGDLCVIEEGRFGGSCTLDGLLLILHSAVIQYW